MHREIGKNQRKSKKPKKLKKITQSMIASLWNTSNYSIEFICEICLQSYAI